MNRRLFINFTMPTVLFASACQSPVSSPRQEVLDKVRGIGIATTPLVATINADDAGSSEVTLELYASVPKGQIATVSVVNPAAGSSALALTDKEITIKSEDISYQDLGPIQLMVAKLTAKVPTTKSFSTRQGSTTVSGSLSYTLAVVTETGREVITGGFSAYSADATELSWSAPTLTVNSPQDGQQLAQGSTALDATTATTLTNDFVQVGWFVTNGSVASRTASSTAWSIDSSGGQAVIVTARAARSSGFSVKVIKVNVQN